MRSKKKKFPDKRQHVINVNKIEYCDLLGARLGSRRQERESRSLVVNSHTRNSITAGSVSTVSWSNTLPAPAPGCDTPPYSDLATPPVQSEPA